MIKRTPLYKENPPRYSHDDDKVVTYEFQFKGKLVTPGMKFKIKNDRTIYTFICLVHALKADSTWVEAMSVNGSKAVRIEKISQIIVPKRSYKKRG